MIYTAKDVKTACNHLLQETFGDEIAIYGNDTTDGYRRPPFFTEIVLRGRNRESASLSNQGYRFRVTMFERTHDEAFCLDVYEKICRAFEPQIVLANARQTVLPVESIGYMWIDEHADKLQVTIDFAMCTEVDPNISDAEMMENVNIEESIRGHYPERPKEI